MLDGVMGMEVEINQCGCLFDMRSENIALKIVQNGLRLKE